MIYPILQHIGLLFSFRHDGTGLPKETGAIAFILGLCLLCAVLWAVVAGPQVAPGKDMAPMVLISIGLVTAITALNPTLGVVMALAGATTDIGVTIAALADYGAQAQTFGEVLQFMVVLYFYFNSKLTKEEE